MNFLSSLRRACLIVAAYSITGTFTQAQHNHHCALDRVIETVKRNDPEFKKRIEDHQLSAQWKANYLNTTGKTEQVYTIPVVFHVVYNNSAQNISDAQLKTQIDALNRDFRMSNPDVSAIPSVWKNLATDVQFEFCLASKDPNGNPTTGITRTQTSRTIFDFPQVSLESDPLKETQNGGKTAWPTEDYLNIWICSLNPSVGTGWAPLPQFMSRGSLYDGIVLNYKNVGTIGNNTPGFEYGRIGVHEVAHFFDLWHIWGPSGGCSDDDEVNDTPMQQKASDGFPKFPSLSCSGQPNGDMFVNYMDYADNVATVMFTEGQKTRMRAALLGPRAKLITSGTAQCTAGPAPCSSTIGLPYSEGFEGSFPPSGVTVGNQDGNKTWERTNKASKTGNFSVYINNFNYERNKHTDEMYLPPFDFSGQSFVNLKFQVAYATYTPGSVSSEELNVLVREGCNGPYTNVYNKRQPNLGTASNTEQDFIPNPNQWRQETVNLDAFAGKSHVEVIIQQVSDYENNLYIDDIEVAGSQPSGLEEEGIKELRLYPNPTTGMIQSNADQLEVTDLSGKLLAQVNTGTIDISDYPNGVYLIRAIVDSDVFFKRIVKNN